MKNKTNLSKKMKRATIIILIFLFASCGARKRTVNRESASTQTDTKVVKDSTVTTKKDVVIKDDVNENTEIKEENNTITITPIDETLPTIFTNPATKKRDTIINATVTFQESNKQESKNVNKSSVTNDNSLTKVQDQETKKVSQNAKKQGETISVDRKGNGFQILLIVLGIGLAVFAFFKFMKPLL